MQTRRFKKHNLERGAIQWDESLGEQRAALRARPGFTFVHRDQFCELLLSKKKLIRSDEPGICIRGLLDVESGERFVIEQEKLFASSV